MKSRRFFVGVVFGVTLVILVAALALAGLGRMNTSAARGSAPQTAQSPGATPSPPVVKSVKASGTPPATGGDASALEQRMLNAASDAEWNAAANQLGISVDDFHTALDSGKSVAELGSTRNVTVQQINDAMVAAGRAQVAAAVQSGTITQADAATLEQGLVVAIATKVTHANSTPVGTPSASDESAAAMKQAAARDDVVPHEVTAAEVSAAVEVLGITNEQFKLGASSAGALGSYSAAKHVTAQQVKDAMLAAGQTALNQAVHDGTISQAEADQLLHGVVQPLAEKIYQMIAGSGPATPTT